MSQNNNHDQNNNVCVGTIIEDEMDAYNHNNNNNVMMNGNTLSHQQHQQHFFQPQYNHNGNTQNHQVIYATNPQTGETVVFPMIPAAMMGGNNSQPSSPRQGNNMMNSVNNNSGSATINPNQLFPEPNSVYWTTGLFDCFHDMDGCVEAWCCGRCQLSRQYGYLQQGTTDIEPISFICSIVLDALAAPAGIWALAWHTRRGVRRRYGIVGNDCSDCLTVALCMPCATHQAYRELSVHGSWPTGCCIDQPYALPPERRFASAVPVSNGNPPVPPVMLSNSNSTVYDQPSVYPAHQRQHNQEEQNGTSMV